MSDLEAHSRSSEIALYPIGFMLVACTNSVSILYRFRDLLNHYFNTVVTFCECMQLETYFSFDNTFEMTGQTHYSVQTERSSRSLEVIGLDAIQ